MCGELEEEGRPDDDVYARFVAHVHSFLAGMKRKGKPKNADEVHLHLDRMFRELLVGVVDEKRAPEEMSGYERMIMEPLVFARIAGFIAAHVPLSEDPLRRLIDAMMVGYSEGEVAQAHDHEHDHNHDHDHDHGPGRGHAH